MQFRAYLDYSFQGSRRANCMDHLASLWTAWPVPHLALELCFVQDIRGLDYQSRLAP